MIAFALLLTVAVQPSVRSSSEASGLGATSEPLPRCGVNQEEDDNIRKRNIGVIQVILPKPLVLEDMDREVYQKLTQFNPDTGIDKSRGNWGSDVHRSDKIAPFDVYLDQLRPNTNSGYLLVRVILKEKSQMIFHEKNMIHGISLVKRQSEEGDNDKDLLCGQFSIDKREENKGSKQVASFLIDLRKRNQVDHVAFNIIVEPDGIDMPIIIDPKVHDTGHGMLNDPPSR